MRQFDKPNKVLHILSGFGMGGAETWMLEIVKYIAKHPELNYPQMEFLCTSGKKAILDDEILKYGAVIHYITLNKKNIFTFIIQYRKLLKVRGFIAIHDHQDFLCGWHFLMGIGLNPKTKISHVHNSSYQIIHNYGESIRHRLIQKLGKKLTILNSTFIGGTSLQVLAEYGFDISKPNIFALHCAFDLLHYDLNKQAAKELIFREFGLDEKTKLILFVGRLDNNLDENHPQTQKNSFRTLNIFKKLKDPDTVLIMVGNNSQVKEEYIEYIKGIKMSKRIILAGIRNDVPNLMQASNLLLFPSRAEGLGMVAVEAQACSLKVIASTSVPRECIVIEELTDFIDLKKSNKEWSEIIEQKLNQPKIDVSLNDVRWQTSPFNIKNSTEHLIQLYTENEKN